MPNQTLSLAQTQQLQMVLAPQLRQSLEMLQLPVMELQTMIQQELEKNPAIEESLVDVPPAESPQPASEQEDRKELDFSEEYEALSRLDDEWKDYFFQDQQATQYTPDAAVKRQFMLDSLPQKESLQQHLLNQLRLAGLSENEYQMGELLIGSLNEDGYLAMPLDELAQSASFDAHKLEDILAIIQDFHPTGVGARNLKECLLIQIEKQNKHDSLASAIIQDHLDRLGAKKYSDIARILKVSPEEVQDTANFIATLDPRPGRIYSGDVAAYITPEVIVQKIEGEYVIILNDDNLPHLRISNYYRELMNQAGTADEVKSYIKDKIRSGVFLIRSIHQRQKTIYRIASEIVKTQKDFLDFGISRLRPLTMAEVAKEVGVHETTVSRAVSSKYMQTPSGIFEMKYFFTPGIKTLNGSSLSNKTVQDIISNMVAAEDPAEPMSDQAIMEQLGRQGINIARRTIAKYRLLLNIPPSHMRKIY